MVVLIVMIIVVLIVVIMMISVQSDEVAGVQGEAVCLTNTIALPANLDSRQSETSKCLRAHRPPWTHEPARIKRTHGVGR